MLKLGSDVVATTTGRIQQHAATVILETARSASGVSASDVVPVFTSSDTDWVPGCTTSDRVPGCATARLDEVNVLLNGLQSASVALREVTIQVSNIRDVRKPNFSSVSVFKNSNRSQKVKPEISVSKCNYQTCLIQIVNN